MRGMSSEGGLRVEVNKICYDRTKDCGSDGDNWGLRHGSQSLLEAQIWTLKDSQSNFYKLFCHEIKLFDN